MTTTDNATPRRKVRLAYGRFRCSVEIRDRSAGARRAALTDRYEIIAEPCGRFAVWDRQARAPAVLADRPLTGLTAEEARELRRLLSSVRCTSENGAMHHFA